jgi:glutamine synthetase
MIIARFLLERIAEKYDVVINYTPKLYKHINGSGCHTNFSTSVTRDENGIEEIYKCMSKLEKKHSEHIAVYGKDNENRLTGIHETSSINTFSFGVGTRNTSVRIPNQVVKDGCGYFEDRRPAANIDPYQVTSLVFQTCCLDEF